MIMLFLSMGKDANGWTRNDLLVGAVCLVVMVFFAVVVCYATSIGGVGWFLVTEYLCKARCDLLVRNIINTDLLVIMVCMVCM